jgi:hypothetical protein
MLFPPLFISLFITKYVILCPKFSLSLMLNLITGAFVNIRVELAKCIGNPLCAANIACLQTCNNRPDETECQVSSLSFSGYILGLTSLD